MLPRLNGVKPSRQWIVYSAIRLGMFAAILAILILVGVNPIIATIGSAAISFCLSYIFLRAPRDNVAKDLYEVRHRAKEPVHPDAESEDAAVDRAAAADSNPAGTKQRPGTV